MPEPRGLVWWTPGLRRVAVRRARSYLLGSIIAPTTDHQPRSTTDEQQRQDPEPDDAGTGVGQSTALLVGLSGYMWWRAQQEKVDSSNVNADWDESTDSIIPPADDASQAKPTAVA